MKEKWEYTFDRKTRIAAITIFAAGISSAIIYYNLERSQRLHYFLDRDLFKAAFEACLAYAESAQCAFGLPSHRTAEGSDYTTTTGLDVIQLIGALSGILGAGAAALGASLALGRPLSTSTQVSANEFNAREGLPRLFLFLTSAFFTIGMICIFALLQFPKAVLSDADFLTYRSAASGVSIYFGISYSLVIAGFYIPISMAQINIKRNEYLVEDEVDKLRTRSGQIQRHIETFLAVIAPVLTTIVADLGAFAFAP
ncbi:MAG: hypothetical protein AAGE18_18340 [Pseudomonadota bacterium]